MTHQLNRKNKLSNLNDKFNLILWIVTLISFFFPLVYKLYHYQITVILFYFIAFYYLITALYFKKSMGFMGVKIGISDNGYLLFGTIRFVAFILLGRYYSNIFQNLNNDNLLIYGLGSLITALIIIFIYKKFSKDN